MCTFALVPTAVSPILHSTSIWLSTTETNDKPPGRSISRFKNIAEQTLR